MEVDVCILGAGPAGLSAAIYCKRANLNVLVLDNFVLGGNLNNYLQIENYLGMNKISTADLIEKFSEHIIDMNIEVKQFAKIQNIDLLHKIINVDNEEIKCKYIIIATGSKPKLLGIPGEEEYTAKGVHYCAICDGPMYKDKVVAVIGGGNSACEEALGLSKICEKVYLIEYTDKLNAEQTTIDKINNTKNIEVYTGYALVSIEKVQQDKLDKYDAKGNWFYLNCCPREMFEQKKDIVTLESYPPILKLWVNGTFVYVGMSPNYPHSEPQLACDKFGYIQVNENMETSINGVYAIGDVSSKKYRQVVTAISDGAIAAIHISKSI